MAPLWMSRSYRFFRPRFTVGLGMKHHVKVRTDPQVHPWIWGQKSQIYGVSTSFHASIEDIEGLQLKYKRGMSMHGWRQDSRIANCYRLRHLLRSIRITRLRLRMTPQPRHTHRSKHQLAYLLHDILAQDSEFNAPVLEALQSAADSGSSSTGWWSLEIAFFGIINSQRPVWWLWPLYPLK